MRNLWHGRRSWKVTYAPFWDRELDTITKVTPFQSAYKTSVQEIANNPDLPAQISHSAANIPSATNQSVVFRVSSPS